MALEARGRPRNAPEGRAASQCRFQCPREGGSPEARELSLKVGAGGGERGSKSRRWGRQNTMREEKRIYLALSVVCTLYDHV